MKLSFDGIEITGLRELPERLSDAQALRSFHVRSLHAENVEVKRGSVIGVNINGETADRIVESITDHGDSVEVVLVPWSASRS